MGKVRLFLCTALSLTALPSHAADYLSRCIEYGAVSLEGILVRQVYAGPPDFESVQKGDAPITIWILQLNERTCVDSYVGELREIGVLELQIEWDASQQSRYRELLGKRLIVDGELVRGGARHEKRLVLVVREMRLAPTLLDRSRSGQAYPQ